MKTPSLGWGIIFLVLGIVGLYRGIKIAKKGELNPISFQFFIGGIALLIIGIISIYNN